MATIGGFELKGRAGVGGMGELFFATRVEPLPGFPVGQPVVLKWVPHNGPNPQWLAALHHELDTLCRLHEVNFAQLSATGGIGIAQVQPVGLDGEVKWAYLGVGVVEGDTDAVVDQGEAEGHRPRADDHIVGLQIVMEQAPFVMKQVEQPGEAKCHDRRLVVADPVARPFL